MIRSKFNFLYLGFGLLLFSCHSSSDLSKSNNVQSNGIAFAKRFSVKEFPEYTILTVSTDDQSNQSNLHYLLFEGAQPIVSDTLIPVKFPIRSLVSNSTTHLPLLTKLGSEEILTGFAQCQYIYSPSLREKVQLQSITEIGRDAQLDVETIVNLDPSIVMAYSTAYENKQLIKLQELGITVVSNLDYLENTALGKAEWIKFMGYLLNKSSEANAYFDQLVIKYDSLKSMANSLDRVAVFSGNLYGGTWYTPGGKNYNADLIADAGGHYLWSDNTQTGGLNLDFETVYLRCWQAKIWIGASNFNSLDEMAQSDMRYADFEAFKNGNVFTYTGRINEIGANDYFESGNINPDILLADHIKMIHPEILPEYELYYYKKLE